MLITPVNAVVVLSAYTDFIKIENRYSLSDIKNFFQKKRYSLCRFGESKRRFSLNLRALALWSWLRSVRYTTIAT
jgi:hypothetical protein